MEKPMGHVGKGSLEETRRLSLPLASGFEMWSISSHTCCHHEVMQQTVPWPERSQFQCDGLGPQVCMKFACPGAFTAVTKTRLVQSPRLPRASVNSPGEGTAFQQMETIYKMIHMNPKLCTKLILKWVKSIDVRQRPVHLERCLNHTSYWPLFGPWCLILEIWF